MTQNQTNQDAMFYATNERAALVAVGDAASASPTSAGRHGEPDFVDTVRSWWKDGAFKVGGGGGQEFLVEMMRQANQTIVEHSTAWREARRTHPGRIDRGGRALPRRPGRDRVHRRLARVSRHAVRDRDPHGG